MLIKVLFVNWTEIKSSKKLSSFLRRRMNLAKAKKEVVRDPAGL